MGSEMCIRDRCDSTPPAKRIFLPTTAIFSTTIQAWKPVSEVSEPRYDTIIIIRLHHSTTQVHSAYCERPSSVVCLSICHPVSPAKISEAIEIPFAFRTRVGPGKDVLRIADCFRRILYCFHSTQYRLLVGIQNYPSGDRLHGSASVVLTATGFVNGKGQFSAPYRIDTPQPITKKLSQIIKSATPTDVPN